MPFKVGDRVQWNHGRNVCLGEIIAFQDTPVMVGKREIHPSLRDPTWRIKTDSGSEAFHHTSALSYVKAAKKEEEKGFAVGEKVHFQVAGNTVEGEIIRKLDDMEKIGDTYIHASEVDPQYLIKTTKDKEIHHHLSALAKIGEEITQGAAKKLKVTSGTEAVAAGTKKMEVEETEATKTTASTPVTKKVSA